MIVGEVAHDREVELGCLVESDEPRAGTHPRVAAEPAALDRLQDETGAAGVTKTEIGAEGGEEVGVDGRCHRAVVGRCVSRGVGEAAVLSTKKTSAEVFGGELGVVGAL